MTEIQNGVKHLKMEKIDPKGYGRGFIEWR